MRRWLFWRQPAVLRDRVVVITGASSGIGAAAAHAFAREEARVVLAARRAEKLREVAKALEPYGVEALVLPTDVTRSDDLRALVDDTVSAFGRIDVLVNNAGLAYGGHHESIDPERLYNLVHVNLYGPMRLVQCVLPIMRAQGSGHIVNVSSMSSQIVMPGQAAYTATRLGLVGFSVALRRELRGTGIRVSSVLPSFTSTSMTGAVDEEALHMALPFVRWQMDAPEVPARAIVDAVRGNRQIVYMGGVFMRLGAAVHRHMPGVFDLYLRWVVPVETYIQTMRRLGEG